MLEKQRTWGKKKTMDLEGCIFKWSVGFVGKVNWTMVILTIFKSRFNQEREYQTRKDIFPSFFNQKKEKPDRTLGSDMKQAKFS